ncbi:MAG TPA: hypothetical protein VIG99_27610 [Myxococcaceae bacterium]|jgi:hypothetical protein
MGCATARPSLTGTGGSGLDTGPICGGLAQRGHWPDSSAGDEALLAPFLACASPAEFVELQRGVDMPRLVAALDDRSAIRLGAMGPLVAGADVLTRKRAAFLVDAEEEYGASYAEVLALYVINAAYDDELRALLELLAKDKQLQQTLGPMCNVKAELERRGLRLSDFPERGERLGDVGRGLGRAARDALRTSELSQGARFLNFTVLRRQLPPPYQDAVAKVDEEMARQRWTPGNVALGCFDFMTFGVPVGIYGLVVGTADGAASLWNGEYEKATRELAPAALLVALHAGGKGLRALSQAEGLGWRGLPLRVVVELRLGALRELVGRLQAQLGESGVARLARYLQAQREAAVLVAAGGEPAALALYEAEGNVPRARAFLAKAEAGATGAASLGRAAGGLAALVDETAGLTAEVVESKLLAFEVDTAGPRLPADPALLEQVRPRVDVPPPGVPEGFKPWKDYVAYRERRLAELKAGKKAKGPLWWDSYQGLMGQFARGLEFGRAMADRLRADAKLLPGQRRWLGAFKEPSIETNVGVAKAGVDGVRYADVLVIEKAKGQPPHVESFSLKSRDFSGATMSAPVAAQMKADAAAALRFYGETLDIRRPSLKHLGPEVEVRRVRLVYEGGKLMPKAEDVLDPALRNAREAAQGVEVDVQ